MRFQSPIRAAALGLACAALATAAPFLSQEDRVTSDRDLSKVADALGDWFDALSTGKGKLEAESDFSAELAKLNEKKLKGGDLLAHPADLGQLVYLANKYDRKAPKRANGKILEKKDEDNRVASGYVEYAVWTPSKYKPKDGPYRLVISIPDEGDNPEKHISENYVTGDLLDTTVIVAPKMPGDSKEWSERAGLGAVLLTLGKITDVYAVDVEQVFIGGRGKGGEAALAIANMFPDRFAGAFCWAGDGGEGVTAANLRHVPVIITGGGKNATGLVERAKEAELENVTLEPAGGEAEIFAWMVDKKRANYPDKFSIVPGASFPTRAYWAQFAPTEDMSNVRLDAEVNRETNTITLTGTGILECVLYLSDGVVDLSRPVTVIANGSDPVVNQFERSGTQFLQFLKEAKVDPARVVVAAQQYALPAVATEPAK